MNWFISLVSINILLQKNYIFNVYLDNRAKSDQIKYIPKFYWFLRIFLCIYIYIYSVNCWDGACLCGETWLATWSIDPFWKVESRDSFAFGKWSHVHRRQLPKRRAQGTHQSIWSCFSLLVPSSASPLRPSFVPPSSLPPFKLYRSSSSNYVDSQ
jgi:hypothetical protein